MLWNSSLECGIPAIDEQHKELFRQVDILLDNTKKDRVADTLNFLGAYVQKHFATEEAMHQRCRYPKAIEHKRIHDDFVKTYKELRAEYEQSGHKLDLLLKINKAAVGWLKEHVMGHDREFSTYYKESQK